MARLACDVPRGHVDFSSDTTKARVVRPPDNRFLSIVVVCHASRGRKRSHRPAIALQDRDVEIIRTVFEYRLISTPQILRLFQDESHDGIYRRLQRLFHHAYLDRIGTNPNAAMRHGLGPRGADLLGVSRRKEVSDPYVDHQLMIGNFRVAMTTAAREQAITFVWRPAPIGAPVRPDGFFNLQFPDDRTARTARSSSSKPTGPP